MAIQTTNLLLRTNNLLRTNTLGQNNALLQPPNGIALATPTFTLSAGTSQTVTIGFDANATATYYTTNGSTPTNLSTLYTGAFSISTSETVKAFSQGTSPYLDSAVGSHVYVKLAPPTFAISAGDSQTVTISFDASATVTYFTVTGSNPTTGSPQYSTPFAISVGTIVKAISAAVGFVTSDRGLTTFSQQATPTFSPVAGTYGSTQTVTITSAGSTAMYYTVDGSTPTVASGTLVTGTVSVAATETLKALAVQTGLVNSTVGSAAYTISTPFTFVVSGVNTGTGTVTLDTSTATLLVAVLADSAGQPAATIADSKLNTWHYLTFQHSIRIAYAYAPTVGAGHVFTPGGTFPAVAIYAFTGGATTAACFVNQNGATLVTPAPYKPGPVTPAAGEVVIAGISNGLGVGPTSIDSGFIDLRKSDSFFTFGAARLIAADATPVNPTWTTSAFASDVVIATFMVA